MTVRIAKPPVNIREKLAELERPIGLNGQALLGTETPQEAFDLLGAGRRNLIINGAMEIFQRGTNPVTSLTTESFALCDRWSFGILNAGTWTASQEGNNPAPGFKSSYKVTLTSASFNTTSAYCFLAHSIEGFNLSDLGYGTSFAKNLTLSFWVKSNYPGTYIIEFEHVSSTNKSISKSYTINQSGVWEYKTITIPGNPNLEFIRDNARRLRVFFWVAAGTSYTSGTLNTNWNTQTSTTRVAGISNGIATNVNGYFEFTGVQLEVGKVATPFEYRSYGQELALCQRYYQIITTGNGFTRVVSGPSKNWIYGQPMIQMRSAPSVSADITGTNANRTYIFDDGQTGHTVNSGQNLVLSDAGANTNSSYYVSFQSSIVGYSGIRQPLAMTTGVIFLSSEL